MAIMEWFKINGYNYMHGSLRLDTPVQRLVFIELMALASISRVRRTVCLSEGIPYPRQMLAGIIGISEAELNDAIKHHTEPDIGRLKINDWGGIEVTKWDKYQSESYERVRKYREKQRLQKVVTPDVTESVTACNGIEKKRKEEKERTEGKTTAQFTTYFVEFWNSKNRLPKIKILTDKRRASLKARMSKKLFADSWQQIIEKIAASDFLCGYNDRKWRANMDWLLKNDTNYVKVLEGNYDNQSPAATTTAPLIRDKDGRTPRQVFMQETGVPA